MTLIFLTCSAYPKTHSSPAPTATILLTKFMHELLKRSKKASLVVSMGKHSGCRLFPVASCPCGQHSMPSPLATKKKSNWTGTVYIYHSHKNNHCDTNMKYGERDKLTLVFKISSEHKNNKGKGMRALLIIWPNYNSKNGCENQNI